MPRWLKVGGCPEAERDLYTRLEQAGITLPKDSKTPLRGVVDDLFGAAAQVNFANIDATLGNQDTSVYKLFIVFTMFDPVVMTIGDRLIKLCRGNVRAMRLIMREIDVFANQTLPLFTPGDASTFACFTFWGGMNTRHEHRLELLGMGEKLEDIASLDIPSDMDIGTAMPHWSFASYDDERGSRPERRRFEAMMDRIDPTLAAAVRRLRAANEAIDRSIWGDDDIYREDDFGPTFVGLVQIFDDDIMPRLYDDWAEDHWNSGGGSVIGGLPLDLTTGDGGRSQVKTIRAHAEAMVAIEALFDLLSTQDASAPA